VLSCSYISDIIMRAIGSTLLRMSPYQKGVCGCSLSSGQEMIRLLNLISKAFFEALPVIAIMGLLVS
jgi:hypothetical protein